jgi:hypothetical protein
MMVVWAALMKWWRARQRKVDIEILWPICLKEASDLDHAKAAFAMHVFNDEAWVADFNEGELIAYIDKLGEQ